MKWEVRCCCDARLIGWLDVEIPHGKNSVIFPVFDFQAAAVFEHALETVVQSVKFEIALFTKGLKGDRPYRCLKSEHYPIEALRRIPGFTEALEEEKILADFVVSDEAKVFLEETIAKKRGGQP